MVLACRRMEMERLKVEQLRQSSMSPHEKLIQETTLIQSISFMVLLQTTTIKFWNVKIFEKRRRKSVEDLMKFINYKQEIKTATEFDINEVWKKHQKRRIMKNYINIYHDQMLCVVRKLILAGAVF